MSGFFSENSGWSKSYQTINLAYRTIFKFSSNDERALFDAIRYAVELIDNNARFVTRKVHKIGHLYSYQATYRCSSPELCKEMVIRAREHFEYKADQSGLLDKIRGDFNVYATE